MKKWNRILAAALSLSMVGGSVLSSPAAVYGAEESAAEIVSEDGQTSVSEEVPQEDFSEMETPVAQEEQEESAAETEETPEIQDPETQDSEETASITEDQTLDPDPSAENSWRYSDGQPVSMPSTYADDPNAWEKVDGQFVNSNGEVIPGAVMKGIDVSEHNGKIDWEKVKNDGIDFAIIRCGYGQDMESQDDDYWEANVEACEALGIPYGVYLYSYADTLEKAQSEAQHVLRLLKGHDPAYPVYYDLEDNITLELSDSMKTQIATTFCNIITDNGYETGVYSSLYWWNDYLTDPVFNNWSRWVAQWNPTCDYQGEYDLWQCSSTGQVDGINGNVDLNFLIDNGANTTPGVTEEPGHVLYSTHAQTYGWLDEVADGAVSGTTGEQKRLEAIAIRLSNGTEGGIQYSTHVQTYGWQDCVSDGAVAGTTGEAKRLEAIKIQLTGAAAENYDIYYSVHAQTFGWLGWAKNGEPAGTSGYAKRLEAIKIQLVPKGGEAPGTTEDAYLENEEEVIPAASVEYSSHVQTYGWQDFVADGALSGTTGEQKRLEAVKIRLNQQPFSGDIQYSTHVQTYGWQDFVSNGVQAGTTGEQKRMEAVKIRLTGEMSQKYDIYYRVHSQTYGWLGWAKNGEPAGTSGYAKRMEAIEIRILPKGSSAPGSTANAYYEK